MYHYEIGDLLLRRGTDEPALIVGVKDSSKKVWGDASIKRKLYRIYNNRTGKSEWIADVEISVKFQKADERGPPPNKRLV